MRRTFAVLFFAGAPFTSALTAPLLGAQDWNRADSLTVRLSPDSFPALPAAVRADLRRRGCTIPQTHDNPKSHNVITGSFISAGSRDWAVLCSSNRESRTLVYRDGAVTVIDTFPASADRDFLQGVGEGRIGFSRVISMVTASRIRSYARAFQGPEPPTVIDHQGIEDAFLGKGSGIAYFYRGTWLSLAGAN